MELAPDHAKAHNYLGLALAQAGEYGRAREAFLHAGSEAMAEKMARALAVDRTSRPAPSAAPANPTPAALTLAASKTFVGMVAAAAPTPPEPAPQASPPARPYDAMLAQGLGANGTPPVARVVPAPPAPIPLVLEQRAPPPSPPQEDEPLDMPPAPPPVEEATEAASPVAPRSAEAPVPVASAELSELAASLRLVGVGEASPLPCMRIRCW